MLDEVKILEITEVDLNKCDEEMIEISWSTRKEEDDSRRGTMYCFKSCQVNQN